MFISAGHDNSRKKEVQNAVLVPVHREVQRGMLLDISLMDHVPTISNLSCLGCVYMHLSEHVTVIPFITTQGYGCAWNRMQTGFKPNSLGRDKGRGTPCTGPLSSWSGVLHKGTPLYGFPAT